LLPTVVLCEDPSTNSQTGSLCSLCERRQVTAEQLTEALGPSLVVTAITSDANLINRLVASPNVDRLNIGAVPTNQISWDQPHEGNLFEHLYGVEAFHHAVGGVEKVGRGGKLAGRNLFAKDS